MLSIYTRSQVHGSMHVPGEVLVCRIEDENAFEEMALVAGVNVLCFRNSVIAKSEGQ